MNVRQYHDRIKVSQIQAPSYTFLQELLLNHLITIPFENLDIRQGVEVSTIRPHRNPILHKKPFAPLQQITGE